MSHRTTPGFEIPIIMGLYPRREPPDVEPFKRGLRQEIETSLRLNPWYADRALFLAADAACAALLEGFGLTVSKVMDDAPLSVRARSAHRMKLWMSCWAAETFGECLWVDWDTVSLRLPDAGLQAECRSHGTPKFIRIEGYAMAKVNNGVQYCPASWTPRLRAALAEYPDLWNDEHLWERTLPDDVVDRPEYWFGPRVQYVSKRQQLAKVSPALTFAHLGSGDFSPAPAMRRRWLEVLPPDAPERGWKECLPVGDGTHHARQGVACYAPRFDAVGKFHAPGLAPCRDASGAYHVLPHGLPAYGARHRATFGYYEGRAAAVDAQGWFHLDEDGQPLYARRYAWAGNFQEGRATVRQFDGLYRYLDREGQEVGPHTYRYAGDYRDGVACVRDEDGTCRHVGPDGTSFHEHRYLDLDVYHKGFARARDERGWFHVERSGRPDYAERFQEVEPFYNGQARAVDRRGETVVIDEDGAVVLRVGRPPRRVGTAGPPLVLITGTLGAGKTTLATALADELGLRRTGIDELRVQCGDGSPAGELRAWSGLLAELDGPASLVVELSGSGPFMPLWRKALEESGRPYRVLWLRTPLSLCLQRLAGRTALVPYPQFGQPLETTATELHDRLEAEMQAERHWTRAQVVEVDGRLDLAEQLSRVRSALDGLFGKEVGHE